MSLPFTPSRLRRRAPGNPPATWLLGAIPLAIAVAVALALAAPHDRAIAQPGPFVRVELEHDVVEVGATFDAYVFIENVDDLAGFDFQLTYDEAFLSYQGVEMASFLGSGGRSVVQLGPSEQPGRIAFGAVSIPAAGQSAASGSGDLAVFVFRALAVGGTDLDLESVHLQYDDGSTLEPRAEGATVTIVDAYTPTPPAPTETPEPPPLESGAYLPWAQRSRR